MWPVRLDARFKRAALGNGVAPRKTPMFTEDVPDYTIDLTVDESRRWAEVIAREGDAGRPARP